MSRREQRRIVRANRRRLFLEAWERERAQGTSLSAFCRAYGLSRKNFYLWLGMSKRGAVKNPIQRSDPALKAKALEIFFRYRGTWGAQTIALALRGKLGASTIRKVVRPYRDLWRAAAKAPAPRGEAPPKTRTPNVVWSTDWMVLRYGAKIAYLWLLIDEATRYCLGWELLDHVPTAEDVTQAIGSVFARQSNRPLILKSDRAKVFRSSGWESVLGSEGVTPLRARPRVPQDQAVIERFNREVRAWFEAAQPASRESVRACVNEGILMLNFLKPRHVLGGRTPAMAHWGGEARTEELPLEERRESLRV